MVLLLIISRERKILYLCFPKTQTHFKELGRQFDITLTQYRIRRPAKLHAFGMKVPYFT